MKVIESWEDPNGQVFAIVEHSPKMQCRYRLKRFEAVFVGDLEGGELCSFGGSVGYNIADFDTLEEARGFLLRGIEGQDRDPDIWLHMVEVG